MGFLGTWSLLELASRLGYPLLLGMLRGIVFTCMGRSRLTSNKIYQKNSTIYGHILSISVRCSRRILHGAAPSFTRATLIRTT